MRKYLLLINFFLPFFLFPSFLHANIQEDIDALNQTIDTKTEKLNELKKEIDLYSENIQQKQEDALTLESEIETLEDSIAKHEKEVEKNREEIDITKLEIQENRLKISDLESEIQNNETELENFLQLLYEKEQKTYLEIFFTTKSLSEFSSQLESLNTVEEKIRQVVVTKKGTKQTLRGEREELVLNKKDLEQKTKDLESQIAYTDGEKLVKKNILDETDLSEKKFQELIEKVRQEETQVNERIDTLEISLRNKLKEKEAQQKQNTNTSGTPAEDEIISLSGFDPMWPIDSRNITTYFRDPTYIFRRYFEHDAVDIATPQGSEIYAADDGYVAIAHFDGTTSYAYISIIHGDGYSTSYGHVSGINVEPEQYVRKGEVIGKTGGTPGTPGAGSFTTGPHIHFRVSLNGIPIDPLGYLPQ